MGKDLFCFFFLNMIPLLQTIGILFLLLCRLLSLYDVFQLHILMSSLVYGCCDDAAVQYCGNIVGACWALHSHFVLLCLFLLLQSWGKEGELFAQCQSRADMLHL